MRSNSVASLRSDCWASMLFPVNFDSGGRRVSKRPGRHRCYKPISPMQDLKKPRRTTRKRGGCSASVMIMGGVRRLFPCGSPVVTVTGMTQPGAQLTADLPLVEHKITITFPTQDAQYDGCSKDRNRGYPSRALNRQHSPLL